jgi:uridine kinase
MTTVICLDDYHCLDRKGRAEKGVTALAPEAQNFDLMYEQVIHTACRHICNMAVPRTADVMWC